MMESYSEMIERERAEQRNRGEGRLIDTPRPHAPSLEWRACDNGTVKYIVLNEKVYIQGDMLPQLVEVIRRLIGE